MSSTINFLETYRRWLLIWIAVSPIGTVSAIVFVGTLHSEHAAAEPLQFNRDVRPLLAERCFHCHGPDASTREADLRLDESESATADRGGYQVVAPGDPDASVLLARVASVDPDLRMPPHREKWLSTEEIELLRKWISEGARWQQHWSFVAPVRPKLADIPGSGTSHPIDLLINATLAQHGITPAPPAERRTLIRRLSFDLTGLPPKPEEVAAFVSSREPDAYKHLVERLLNSPHFGERMATYWLDLVRYADTNGFHGDVPRPHTPYRDYVINAFNSNKPFDEFTREQLAGDLLPNPTNEQKIASGYNRLNMTTEEGGAQPKEYQAKYDSDRVRNFASVWLSLTLGCAECHDHKYDPLLMRDFYSLAAFFADVQENPVGTQRPEYLLTPKQEKRIASLQQQIADLMAELYQVSPKFVAEMQAWIANRGYERVAWFALEPQRIESESPGKFVTDHDGSIVRVGPGIPNTDTYTLDFFIQESGVTALRLEVLHDPSLPNNGPGLAPNGNFVLNEISVTANDEPVRLVSPVASFSQATWDIAGAIDDDLSTGWAIYDQVGTDQTAVLHFEQPLEDGSPLRMRVRLSQQFGGGHVIGKFRISVTTLQSPSPSAHSLPESLVIALREGASELTNQQRAMLATIIGQTAPALEPIRQRIKGLEGEISRIREESAVLVTTAVEPRTIRILPKGNWLDDSGEIVEPDVPACLPDLDITGRRPTRLDLANWLVQPDNPLVARTFVNRLWLLLFGRGLVETADDFGAQGAWPTHPELLDWLAVEFIESGWDIKHMVRLIVTSDAYQRTSHATAQLARIDPTNSYLGRQNRFTLEAEMIRDNALAVSGLLCREIGGLSCKPYQPAGYWEHLNYPRRDYHPDQGQRQYRRGLYTHWQRTLLHPALQVFDAPSREACTAQRPRSNTPLQALVLLNDPTQVEAARVLATQVLRSVGDDVDRGIQYAVKSVLARDARQEEIEILRKQFEQQQRLFTSNPSSARTFLSIGNAPLDEQLDAPQLAAWTCVVRVLLNLYETITRN